MSILFNSDGTVSCYRINTAGNSIRFDLNYEIYAGYVNVDSSLTTPPYFSSYNAYQQTLNCKGITATAAAPSNFYSHNQTFSDLCEAPYKNFSTVTLTGLSPTQTFIKYNNQYGQGIFRIPAAPDRWTFTSGSAAPRGYIASNNVIRNLTTRGSYIEVKQVSGGVSIGGTTYYNSTRGSYPIYRVGLFLAAGGGGGGAGAHYVYSTAHIDRSAGGGGGGGGGKVLATLFLNLYDYRIYIGNGGSGGTASSTSGSSGESSIIQYRTKDSSDSWTTIVTCNGGSGGGGAPLAATSAGTGGSGGTVSAPSLVNYIDVHSSITGGAGGDGKTSGNGNTGTTASACAGYFNRIYEADAYVSLGSIVRGAGTYYGSGGGCYGTRGYYYGNGGNGGQPTSTQGYVSGTAGDGGLAIFYY